jgi:acetoin:2,6-dichlorophenolindophenol oxidoreductase subunit alpha
VAQVIESHAASDQRSQPGLDRAAYVAAFERMLLIRRFEERCVELQIAGEVMSSVSAYVGQEATAVALGLVLGEGDLVFTNHRNHGHLLGRGADPGRILAEVMGRSDGYCHGKSGTWHISDAAVGVALASAIVGAATVQAVGAGLAFSRRGLPNVSVACLGDRSMNEGTTWEAFNMAALWQLPVVFLCENNDAFPYDPVSNSDLAVDRLIDALKGFHIHTEQVSGTDLAPVYAALQAAAERTRGGGGPSFVEVLTVDWPGRLSVGRYTYETGPTRLEAAWEQPPEGAHRLWYTHEPLLRTARYLVDQGYVDRAGLEALDHQVRARVAAADEFAHNSPWPEPAAAFTHVFG